MRDGHFRIQSASGRGRADRRLYRKRDRWIRRDRAGVQDVPRLRTTPHFSVFHSRDNRQPGVRLRLDPHGGERAKLGGRHGRLQPYQIDYVNAHGTSTDLGDRAETMAMKRCFGEHAYKMAVSSTKSMTGHLLGGAGGLEAGITVLAIRDQIAPPTTNYETPDPTCDLDYVPNRARPMKIEYALSNSFGFGGTNGCLIFKRFQG